MRPRLLRERMVSNSSCTSVGARPSEGSSNMMSSGRLIRQRPIASICCSPPDMVPATCRRRSARRGNRAKHLAHRLLHPPARTWHERAHLQVLLDRERGEDLPPLGDLADAEVADAVALLAGDVAAAEADATRRAASRCRQWCGSGSTCPRRWRRRWPPARPRPPTAKPGRGPGRRRRTGPASRPRGSYRLLAEVAIRSPPDCASPRRACPGQ